MEGGQRCAVSSVFTAFSINLTVMSQPLNDPFSVWLIHQNHPSIITHLELVREPSRFGMMFGFAARNEFNLLVFPSVEVLLLVFAGVEASNPWILLSWFSPWPSTRLLFDACWNLRALIRLSLSPWVRTLLDREFLAFSDVWKYERAFWAMVLWQGVGWDHLGWVGGMIGRREH